MVAVVVDPGRRSDAPDGEVEAIGMAWRLRPTGTAGGREGGSSVARREPTCRHAGTWVIRPRPREKACAARASMRAAEEAELPLGGALLGAEADRHSVPAGEEGLAAAPERR